MAWERGSSSPADRLRAAGLAFLLLWSAGALLLARDPDPPAAPNPKARSLAELIALTQAKGIDHPLKIGYAQYLGFDSEMPGKMIWFGPNQTSDRYQRSLTLVLGSPKGSPVALVWKAVKETRVEGIQVFDALSFRSDLNGKLEFAAHGSSRGDEATQTWVAISSETQKNFRKEVDFYLNLSPRLEMNK